MNLFNVYPLYDIEPIKAEGVNLWASDGKQYIDLYGGHAVISIGHNHPHWVNRIQKQLSEISFYSNSVKIRVQEELAEKLGQLSNYPGYHLFLCNSGAEANENALKLASFKTDRPIIVSFTGAFHGRTSLAVAATDNPAIVSKANQTENVVFLPFNDAQKLEDYFSQNGDKVAAVIVEGAQGVAGIYEPTQEFLQLIRKLCTKHGACLILDEVQSGYGRTGKFFAHQWYDVVPDLITVAKGMGNGFPIGGVLISPDFQAKHGLLGTTFGGNHLACAAGLAVLEVLEKENLMKNAETLGAYWKDGLTKIEGITDVRGKGLLIGCSLKKPAGDVRNKLLFEHGMFTGSASDKHTIRLLPALNIEANLVNRFNECLTQVLSA